MHNIKIKYIGFYDSNIYIHENRNTFLPATNKMDYIAEAIVASGKEVEIVSLSWTANKKGYYPSRTTILSDGITLTCGSTFGANKRLLRYFRILWSWIWLFWYLIKNTHKDEAVIVYHSMMIMSPIMLAKKVKKFKLVLEVEEIYQDVVEFSRRMKHTEYKFFEMADKYIYPTELLNTKINRTNKPYSIIYGTYHVEENKKNRFEDNKIHVVYAGTFDPRKGGTLAAATAEYLSKSYHVHIIGFGSNEDTKLLIDKIDQVAKKTDATITYDGLLKGEEYIEFLQRCDIGLSTQIPESTYNETSFPSKILSYMANGLRVVSVRIKAIEISAIGNAVYYYEEQTPKAIAEAIKAIELNKAYDSIELIKKLDKDFIQVIKELMEIQ